MTQRFFERARHRQFTQVDPKVCDQTNCRTQTTERGVAPRQTDRLRDLSSRPALLHRVQNARQVENRKARFVLLRDASRFSVRGLQPRRIEVSDERRDQHGIPHLNDGVDSATIDSLSLTFEHAQVGL